MARDAPTLLVFGTMGSSPYAGTAWQVLHYVEGFRRLGCDVHYVEDSGHWVYDPLTGESTDDPRSAVRAISDAMSWCGLADRWTYRAVSEGEPTFGHSERELETLLHRADALVNLTASTELRDEHMSVPIRVYLETDPGLPQFQVAKGEQGALDYLDAHTHHFTYAENLGRPGCGLPSVPYDYRATRPPVIVDWWTSGPAPTHASYTSIANYRQDGKDIEFDGRLYTWSKHHKLLPLVDLPGTVGLPLELALASYGRADEELLTGNGWRIRDAHEVSTNILNYRSYIWGSRGEFTVAKEQYSATHSGWFSDRSVCYLAAGRPVICEETGFSWNITTGKGLHAFETFDDAVMAFAAVEADYELHSQAARELAERYFDAETLLAGLLADLGLG